MSAETSMKPPWHGCDHQALPGRSLRKKWQQRACVRAVVSCVQDMELSTDPLARVDRAALGICDKFKLNPKPAQHMTIPGDICYARTKLFAFDIHIPSLRQNFRVGRSVLKSECRMRDAMNVQLAVISTSFRRPPEPMS